MTDGREGLDPVDNPGPGTHEVGVGVDCPQLDTLGHDAARPETVSELGRTVEPVAAWGDDNDVGLGLGNSRLVNLG